MKKTLIAAGIAAVVATPAAFAEVSVSGVVEQAFTDTDLVTTGATDAWAANSDNALTFKASEDLGNGLTAFASITLDTDVDHATAGGSNTKDEVVGIKGSFGTVVMGRMEDFTEGKIMSRMTLEGDGSAAGGAVENGSGAANAGRAESAIAYVSPTVNGFHVGVGAYVLPDATLTALGGTGTKDSIDATDIAIFYDNGPLSVAAAHERIKFDAATQKVTTLAVSYTMGDLKGTVIRSDVDNEDGSTASTNDSTDMLYRVDYNMGANRLSVAYNDDELLTNNATKYDIWSFEAAHNFSKRTSVYVNYTDLDASGTTATDSQLTVGMKHKF
jgi:predicted porin